MVTSTTHARGGGVTCNDSKQITEISWEYKFIELVGEIDFKMIPPNVSDLHIYNEPLYGKADISGLPAKMEKFVIEASRFSGTLDLGNLPQSLRIFSFALNKITGVVNLRNIPKSAQGFRISEPDIMEKSLHVGKLPANQLMLRLSRCGFTDITYENPEDYRRIMHM